MKITSLSSLKKSNHKALKIPCPFCTNTRLMDMKAAKEIELEIKCPTCKSVINIQIQDNQICTMSI